MFKKILPFCVFTCIMSANSALATEALFKVITASPAIPADGYSNSCTIYIHGQVVIEHNVNLFNLQKTLTAKEVKTVKLNSKDIKAVIAQAALGKVTAKSLAGASTYQYFAYQKQADKSVQTIPLLDKNPAVSFINDSPVIAPVVDFIDGVCGNIEK